MTIQWDNACTKLGILPGTSQWLIIVPLLFIITIAKHIEFHTVLWTSRRGRETTFRRKIRGNFKKKEAFELGPKYQLKSGFLDFLVGREGQFMQGSNMNLDIK